MKPSVSLPQEWMLGLWMFCRRGGTDHEIGQSLHSQNSWTCDLRDTLPHSTRFEVTRGLIEPSDNETAGEFEQNND